ncbi:hypothetical protein Pan44_37430 [Caulifigura coniformis]|uniref:Uncharacterized protein n=1 Tax=Caulifigura coniformis TaxID=2527983 RepID=A0A517SHW6_9PLAN|nr:hypothetical protein [Caulifigura coniformis]QDT55697.1 hypothetical protein Pan44_37430 [Caulifigura coniformis]
MADQTLVDEVVEAVRSGTASSRSEIAAALGFSTGRATTLIGHAIRTRRLRLAGRDRFQSPTYEVVQGQPSAVCHELAGACI